MRDETSNLYARLHNRADEILHYVWDPIGVAGSPEARDEYDSYVPGVVRLLLAGAAPSTISEHLHALETGEMGLTDVGVISKPTIRAAEVLTAHVQWLRDQDAVRTRG